MSKTSTLGSAHLWLAQVILETGASAGSAKKKRRILLAAAGVLVRFSSWPLVNVMFKGTKGDVSFGGTASPPPVASVSTPSFLPSGPDDAGFDTLMIGESLSVSQ